MRNRQPKNISIRTALKENGLYVYDLVDILGVSETTVTRMMRHELSQDDKNRIITLIEKEVSKI